MIRENRDYEEANHGTYPRRTALRQLRRFASHAISGNSGRKSALERSFSSFNMRKVSPSISSSSLASSSFSSVTTNMIRKSSTLLRRTSKDRYSNVSEGLRHTYKKVLKPLEEDSMFNLFSQAPMEDAEFEAKPMVMLVGQYSTGKTTFIKYLLGDDYPGIRIGPEPTTDRFNIIMYSPEPGVVPGNALVVDPKLQFRPLAKFGNSFLNRLQLSLMNSDILKTHTIIDSPGILSGEKQSHYRGYDFPAVLDWFASRVDRILILFDANKLDISDELRRTIRALRVHDDKLSIILNKSDLVNKTQLLRVYGALMWSLGKVLDNPEVIRVYIGSYWDQQLRHTDWRELFTSEQKELFDDIYGLPRQAALRKLNDFIKRARAAKIQALILNELCKQMPAIFGKDKKKKELIEKLEDIYRKIREERGVSMGDFPDLELTKERLRTVDWTKFKVISEVELSRIDALLSEDMSKLMAVVPGPAPTRAKDREAQLEDFGEENAISSDTPFSNREDLKEVEYNWNQESRQGWVVASHAEYPSWTDKFQQLAGEDGKVPGTVAKEAMLESKLPTTTLSKIWTLSDLDKDGKLDSKEFAIANYLISNKVLGIGLPKELPQFMLPE